MVAATSDGGGHGRHHSGGPATNDEDWWPWWWLLVLQVIIAFTFLVLAGVVGIIVYATLNPNQKVSGRANERRAATHYSHAWLWLAAAASSPGITADSHWHYHHHHHRPVSDGTITRRSSTCRTPSSRLYRVSRSPCRRRPRRRRSRSTACGARTGPMP